ncbi:hypothetical protein GCM10022198_22710 [Klugiella xanthotipulae]|nr:hypothetical protein [Klugiella xanthotipulae]
MIDDSFWTSGSVWFVLAVVTAGLAEQKNRSRWTWFLLGLLLGPLATMLVVVWPAPAAAPSPSATAPTFADRSGEDPV